MENLNYNCNHCHKKIDADYAMSESDGNVICYYCLYDNTNEYLQSLYEENNIFLDGDL